MTHPEKIKLLVLDDEEALLRAFAQLMESERHRYDAEFFTDSNQALEAVTSDPGRYQVILTDIRMPHLDGLKFLETVKSVLPDLPVVIMTGYSSPETKKRVLVFKKVVFLEKPFQLSALLNETIPKLLA